jgi:hypothetical protein
LSFSYDETLTRTGDLNFLDWVRSVIDDVDETSAMFSDEHILGRLKAIGYDRTVIQLLETKIIRLSGAGASGEAPAIVKREKQGDQELEYQDPLQMLRDRLMRARNGVLDGPLIAADTMDRFVVREIDHPDLEIHRFT